MSAAPSPLPEFYTWGFSSAPIQVHLNLEAVSRIRKQFLDSEKDSGVLSACGLLTGGTPKPGITRILDFVSLETLDDVSVPAATDRARGEVVGFYRTTPAGTRSMTAEDRALAARSFRDPRSVFLLIETGKSSIGDARFCFWSESDLFDWPVMLFPFDAAELATKEWRRRPNVVREPAQSPIAIFARAESPADEKVVAAADLEPGTPAAQTKMLPAVAPDSFPVAPYNPRQEAIAPEPVAKRRQLTGGRWLARGLATVVAAALLVGTFMYITRGSKLPVASQPAVSPAEEKARLGLAVEKRGSDLVISWNSQAPMISKANFGMLLIRGGEVSRDVPLTPEELRAGSVVYASPVDQVRFQLNVVAGEQVAREFVTVVLPPLPQRRANPTRPEGGNPNVDTLSPPSVSSASASSPAVKQFKPVENRDSASAAALRMDEPPAVAGAAPVNSGTLALLTQPSGSLSSRQPPTASPGSGDSRNKGNPQGKSSLLSAEGHPPVAAHQVIPAVPPLLRGRLWSGAVVDVQVSVDASGSVVKAEGVAKPGLSPLLRDAAVQAARQWKFQPAQFNGHPVPADIIVRFNFAASR